MKQFSFLILSCLITCSVYSQTDSLSIADRIAKMEYSKSDIISKSRRLLLQEFQAGNKDAVSDIMKYLATAVDDENHLSLWNSERYLLWYWLGDYPQILLNAERMAEDSIQNHRPSVYPSRDILGETLQFEIKEVYYDSILDDYESLHYTPDTNDFLYMFLNRLLDTVSTGKLNDLSDDFQRKYPYSPLITAVQKFVSYKFDYGKYGFGISISGGYNFDSGPITDYISQNGGIMIGLDFYYKKFYFGLSVAGSFGKIKKDIEIRKSGKIWEEGNDISLTKVTPMIGYNLLGYQRFRVTPFAGISFTSAAPYEDEIKDDPYLKDISLGTSVTPVVGLDIDFRLNKIDDYFSPGIWTLGLRTAYWPNVITTQGGGMRGQALFVGLTLKMNMFEIKRVY